MKKILLFLTFLLTTTLGAEFALPATLLAGFQSKWPGNRTHNLVFQGLTLAAEVIARPFLK